MNYIAAVRSTLKKGCHVRLGQRTVIVGPNGSGKSTIVQSIELATTGSVSDMEGRDRVKLSGALARLFNPALPMMVTCESDDGLIFTWEMERKPDGFKTPDVHVPVAVRFPVQEMKELLSGDGAAIASWLESQVVGTSGREELLRRMPPELRDDAEKYIKRRGKADFLALALEAKNEAKNLRSAATRAEKTINSLVEGVPMPMLEDDRDRMRRRVEELDDSMKVKGISQHEMDMVQAELNGAIERYVANQAEQSFIRLDSKTHETAQKLIQSRSLQLEHQAAFGTSDCWVCGEGTATHIEQHTKAILECLTAVKEDILSYEQHQALATERAELEAKMQKLADIIKKTPVSSDNSDERDELIRLLSADEVSAKAWANAKAQRAEVEYNRRKADVLSRLGDEFAKNGKDILRQRKLAFEQKVTSFLPAGEVFGVDLDSSRVGLVRNGELHSALSGAEWSRVLLALTSAQATSSTPCILVPEDRAWDRDTLLRVMKSLSKSPFQIILMATVNPGPVEGWNLVETA